MPRLSRGLLHAGVVGKAEASVQKEPKINVGGNETSKPA